jgi:molybdopterin adenylyltransferase
MGDQELNIRTAILTVSDRSFRGERVDRSGPALKQAVEKYGWKLTLTAIVPDEQEMISRTLTDWCSSGEIDLILTTGGTGFSPRDVTPEATQAVIQRNTPGFCEVMRAESLKVTPHALLSRATAGIRNRTLIVNLPGSPKAAVENLAFIAAAIPHAVELLQEKPEAEAHH